MRMNIIPRLSLAALGAGLALAAQAQTQATLSVTPNPAPASQAFTLSLLGRGGDCFTTFARETVLVAGSRIDLRYTSRTVRAGAADSGRSAACPVGGIPENPMPVVYDVPTFSMPPLKPGKYEVWATDMPACLLETPTCTIAMPAPLSAGVLQVVDDPAPAYTFTPLSSAADAPFDLHLLSYGFNCGTTYDNLTAVVSDGVITLNFLPHENPAAICPAIYMPYGPVFKMPALKAGSYKVKANRLDRSAIVDAGILTLTAGTRPGRWYLKDPKVAEGKAFAMQLLRDDIGSCQTSFSDLGLSVSGRGIAVSFAMQRHPERLCVRDVKPFGPVFEMPSLKAGLYPVSVSVCEGDSARCSYPIAGTVVDTLLVAAASSIKMSDLRRQAPAAELRGRTAAFTLPEGGSGVWRAELMGLDGRILAAATMSGTAGQKVIIPVGAAQANAAAILRLTSPEGRQGFLPLAR